MGLPTAEVLAREFSKTLLRWLGPEKMGEVIRRNRKYTEAGEKSVCASHEFCDANMAMDEAGQNLGMEWSLPCDLEEAGRNPATDPEHLSQVDLWNESWNLAFRNEFWLGTLA